MESGKIIMIACGSWVVLYIFNVILRTKKKSKNYKDEDSTTTVDVESTDTESNNVCYCEKVLSKKDYRFIKFIKSKNEINTSKVSKSSNGDDVMVGLQVWKCIGCGKKFVHYWNFSPTNRVEYAVELEKYIKSRSTNGKNKQYGFQDLES
jgi:hypothetical protein